MKLRAMLASTCRQDPNTSLQHAWSRGRTTLIPLDHTCFDWIADFLRNFDALLVERG